MKFSVREGLRRAWAHGRTFGFLDTAAHVALHVLSRTSYNSFDRRHGTDTADVYGMLSEEKPGHGAAGRSLAIHPIVIRHILRHVGIDYGAFTFVDLGCGKGRALLCASEFPFRRIEGVECSEALCEVARRNAGIYRPRSRICTSIEVVCGDAQAYGFPQGPILAYLFNPFSAGTLARVFENIRRHRQGSNARFLVVFAGLGLLQEPVVLDGFRRANIAVVYRHDTLSSGGSWILGEALCDGARDPA